MMRRKPEVPILYVALICTLTVLVVFLTDLVLARQRDLEAGEQRVQRFGVMMAEHTARSFDAIDMLLREMASDLSLGRRDWTDWDPNQGWEYVAQHHSRAMPQLRDLAIFDRLGNQRFISTYFPPPQISIRSRPYFGLLESGADSVAFGPYVSQNSGRYTYIIGHRIATVDGRFAGVILGALEPAYLQDFCWANRLSDDFEAVLINDSNQIVASCRPTDLSRQSPLMGAAADEALFGGKLRDLVPPVGVNRGNDLLVSVSPVPGFADLRILTAIPEASLLTNWYNRLIELSTLGTLITVVMLVGGLIIRRQVRDMATMTEQLAASHEHLEERIRAATEELAGQKDAAEHANRAKSRFLAAASHDLRQPLHALSLFAADLQRQARSGSAQDLPRLAEQIASSTALLGELLDSLLDISRLDVAGVEPEIRSFPLQPLFERLNSAFRRAAVDRNLSLHFRATRRWLDSDPVMVERIIANLLSNALCYTPSGGRILVAARLRGEEVRIEVRDSGIGIAPEHQAAIFAEFYQVGNPAREPNKGLGLGLSIVDRLARALGVKLSLRSRPGAGATFALHIPLHYPSVRELPSCRPRSEGLVVLFGDSEELSACRKLLESWNYTVEVSRGHYQPPAGAIIIADAARIEEIAQRGPQAPVIAIGASIQELPPGIHALPLPVRPAKLRALVSQLQKSPLKSMP